jgi:hypothetical protein
LRWRLLRGGDPSATRGVEVGNERRVGAAGVVATAELNDAALPVVALAEEFVDLVVEVVEAVLTVSPRPSFWISATLAPTSRRISERQHSASVRSRHSEAR